MVSLIFELAKGKISLIISFIYSFMYTIIDK